MIMQYGSYIMGFIGLFGMWKVGSNKRWGWLVSICTQIIWLAYSFLTKQYGLMPGSAAYMAMYIRNYIRMKPTTEEVQVSEPEDSGRQ